MTIIAIDFEASCLPRHGRSFPIEVGVASGGMARSWLIRPALAWSEWDWTEQAQRLHGLDRAQVEQDGLPVEQVLAELVDAVAGHRVVADSHIDQYWLDTLASAAGRATPFVIEHVAGLLEESRASEDRIAAAVAMADRRCPIRHRARTDALWLSTVVEQIMPAPVAMAVCC